MRFLSRYPQRVLVEILTVGPSSPHSFANGSLQECCVNWTAAHMVQNEMQHPTLQPCLAGWAKECCGDLKWSCCSPCSWWLSCTQICREFIHNGRQTVISFPFFGGLVFCHGSPWPGCLWDQVSLSAGAWQWDVAGLKGEQQSGAFLGFTAEESWYLIAAQLPPRPADFALHGCWGSSVLIVLRTCPIKGFIQNKELWYGDWRVGCSSSLE